MSLYRDHGIVLRTYKLGEADRIVSLITRGRGKVRAVAKGVRKTRSKFGSHLEPTNHIAAQFYEGRGDLDIVTQTQSVDHFAAIREDLDRLNRAAGMLEAVDHVSLEGEANPRLYELLLGALRALAADNSALVTPGFFLKLLALEGFRPVVDRCVSCGGDGPLVAFDMEAGGLLCQECRSGASLSTDAVELLQMILGGRLGAALAVPASASTYEVEHLATRAIEHHLERKLRSVTLLDRA